MTIVDTGTNALALLHRQTGEAAFRIQALTPTCFSTVQRSRYFTMIWVQQGRGEVQYEFNRHGFTAPTILFFTPYQPFILSPTVPLEGVTLQFSTDFYCIEKHRQEISCSGILFNNAYETPCVTLLPADQADFGHLVAKMEEELTHMAAPDEALLLSYLKIFLIRAMRLKKEQLQIAEPTQAAPEHHTVSQVKQLVEEHFRAMKRPADYADLLSLTPKFLSTLVKKNFHKTLTELIQERVIIEAKRELALTEKLVKEIADELGYEDEYYFSRLFKQVTGVSPAQFRKDYRPH